MNKLFSPILKMAFSALINPSIRRAKIRAVIYYIETVRTVREVVMIIGALVFCIALMAGGAILIPLALCLFMPWEPLTRALVVSAFGLIYLLVPIFVAKELMSEKRWMRMTHADALMKDVLSE